VGIGKKQIGRSIEMNEHTELKRDESDKENHCECGLNEQGVWQDEVFDRFGCDCSEKEVASW
jgi:hypothetical protein